MKPAVSIALIAAVAGCRGDPIRRVASPAPAGALECSRRVFTELGYGVTGGEPDGGFLYLQRPAEALVADLIIVEEAEGELRVFASTRTNRNRHAPPTEESLAHVRTVFSRCAG